MRILQQQKVARNLFFIFKSKIRRIQYELAYKWTFRTSTTQTLKKLCPLYRWQGRLFQLPEKPRILFAWPTYDQARCGLLQALQQWGNVTLYRNQQGKPQYFLPERDRNVGSQKEIRRINSEGLKNFFDANSRDRQFDLLFTQAWGFSFSFETLEYFRSRNCKVLNVCMDDRHLFHGLIAPLGLGSGSLSAHCDLVLTNVPESIPLHIKSGARATIFWPEAAGQDFFYPDRCFDERDIDVLFVGQNYGIRGQRVVELQRAGVNVKVYGKGWPNGYASDLPSLYRRSKIVLGCSEVGYCKNLHHIKMRDFEAPMSGACYITRKHDDLSVVYELDKEIMVYENSFELVQKVKSLLAQPKMLVTIARAGLQRALKEHTWEKRIDKLKSLIGKYHEY